MLASIALFLALAPTPSKSINPSPSTSFMPIPTCPTGTGCPCPDHSGNKCVASITSPVLFELEYKPVEVKVASVSLWAWYFATYWNNTGGVTGSW